MLCFTIRDIWKWVEVTLLHIIHPFAFDLSFLVIFRFSFFYFWFWFTILNYCFCLSRLTMSFQIFFTGVNWFGRSSSAFTTGARMRGSGWNRRCCISCWGRFRCGWMLRIGFIMRDWVAQGCAIMFMLIMLIILIRLVFCIWFSIAVIFWITMM